MIRTILNYLEFRKGIIRMVFVDTGEIVKVDHAANKDLFKHNGNDYTINSECFKQGACFYHSEYVEPLSKISMASKAYITTERFNAVYHSKVLKMMMYIKEKDMLLLMAAGIGINICMTVMALYYIIKLGHGFEAARQAALAYGIVI